MKKRKSIILTSAVCICVLLLIVGAVAVKKIFFDTGDLTFTPESDIGVNYNNYVVGNNTLDYRYGKFAWRNGNTLTVVDDSGAVSERWWGNYSFQLYKDGIVYLRYGELIVTDENNESHTVAENVTAFMVLDDSILYLSENDDYDCLYSFDPGTNSYTKLIEADFVISFCASDDRVYVLSESATSNETLTVFDNGVIIDNREFNVSFYPFYLMAAGETLAYITYEDGSVLALYDLDTKETVIIRMSDRTAVDDVVCILNNEFAFVSYRALNYNGSLISTAECESNGLWMIDLSTMQKEKISDETFYQLYLYGDDFLVGVNSKGVFRISKDGSLTELIE